MIEMTRVTNPQDNNCPICLEELLPSEVVLGHKLPDGEVDKIYCYIHENCLQDACWVANQFKCPICRRDIKVKSVCSIYDMMAKHKWEFISKNKEWFGILSLSATIGALILRLAVGSEPLESAILLGRVTESQLLISGLAGMACGMFSYFLPDVSSLGKQMIFINSIIGGATSVWGLSMCFPLEVTLPRCIIPFTPAVVALISPLAYLPPSIWTWKNQIDARLDANP